MVMSRHNMHKSVIVDINTDHFVGNTETNVCALYKIIKYAQLILNLYRLA